MCRGIDVVCEIISLDDEMEGVRGRPGHVSFKQEIQFDVPNPFSGMIREFAGYLSAKQSCV